MLRATLIAAGVAAVLLVTVVMPAEYGTDPLGTGRLLGLTQLSQASDEDAGTVASATTAPPAASTGDANALLAEKPKPRSARTKASRWMPPPLR